MKKILMVSAILYLAGCKTHSKPDQPITQPMENGQPDALPDTLADTPQFVYTIDGQSYKLEPADMDVHYSSTDSTLVIDAGKSQGDKIHITISDVKATPGYRGNAWRSDNTKLAGSDSLVDQPTVIFSKNENGTASWNNLNDGYHPSSTKEDKSLYIYGLRQVGAHEFIIKGHIMTHLYKNVYESAHPDFNSDHKLWGEFVIRFEDYWLKL